MPITDRIDEFRAKVSAAVLEAMENRANETVEEIKESISEPYPPASTVGNPPHMRTGNLRDGVQQITYETNDAVTSNVASSRAEGNPAVPLWMEFGTFRDPAAPRPYMSPAFHESAPKFRADVITALQQLAKP
jgi:hypothetical protein